MELMELLEGRRTYRRFYQKEISEEITGEILRAARLSSSAANKQPLSYVVIRSADKVNQVFDCTRWAGYLKPRTDSPGRMRSRCCSSLWWRT